MSSKKLLIPPPKVVPSILSADFRNLREEVKKVERAGADMLHFDIMDGHFVPNISFGPVIVKALRGEVDLPFLVHLMVDRPEDIIEQAIDAGSDQIIFHIEVSHHPLRILDSIKRSGVKTGIALNPTTPLSTIEYLLEYVDMVLIMTVNPGFGGQKFIPRMFDKIRELRSILIERGINLDVAIDGGADFENVGKIIESGANVIIAGTSIFGQEDVEEATRRFKRIVDESYKKIMSTRL
ncbi:MAG: ribulose-phosphate 3-epimerase [Candidatus Caldarchaeales archaeon]